MSSRPFTTSAGTFDLQRYPARAEEQLLAWNAADGLLIEQILDSGLSGSSLLAVNDDFGALSLALEPDSVWTDSALSRMAIEHNIVLNGKPSPVIIPSTQTPSGSFSGVVLKIPKQLPYLEFQLATIASIVEPGTPVLASGMDKHLPRRTAALLEQYIGPTERHRGRSKSRVFTAIRDNRSPLPTPADAEYVCAPLNGPLTAMANVFSRENIDIGSRFLIDCLKELPRASTLVDLACGNGILGILAKTSGLCDDLGFCDESAMAIESARRNAVRHLPQNTGIHFHQGDGLLEYPGPQAELIICNPPFHLNHTVEEFVGQRLLEQSAKYLQRGGRLCLVANRHLNYLPTLKRGFASVDKLAQNTKFIVWLAQK